MTMTAEIFVKTIKKMSISKREFITGQVAEKINIDQDPSEQMKIIEEIFIENNIDF